MKVLIVSAAFYPSNSPRSFRTTELVKEFVKENHQVTLCIPKSDYDYSIFQSMYPVDILFMPINRAPISLRCGFCSRIINRVASFLFQYPDIKFCWVIEKSLSHLSGFDLLISIAAPHPVHWGVKRLLLRKPNITKCWIADCGDPFMLQKSDRFRTPFYFKKNEKNFCKRADFITVPFQGAIKGYYPEFHKKIRIIPQGFCFDDIKLKECYVPNEIVTFYYSGGFIPGKRDPRPILDFLSKLNIDFRFFIYTRQATLVTSYQKMLGEKLIVKPYIDRLELLYKMSGADFLLNLDNNVEEQLPSKLIDYALTKRPILSINSQNIDKKKFLSFLNRDYSQALRIDVDRYNIKEIVKKFISLKNNKDI